MKNYLKTQPQDLSPGDILTASVTLHIQPYGDPPFFKVYVSYETNPETDEDGTPQGERSLAPEKIAKALFPEVLKAGFRPDW